MPEVPAAGQESDFFFIDRAEPEQIAATLVGMVKARIPRKFGFDPIRDIQVLCPMNRGSLGIRELNVRLQNELNPHRGRDHAGQEAGGGHWAAQGDGDGGKQQPHGAAVFGLTGEAEKHNQSLEAIVNC
jgi:ATP-dependent exoDNAse (exonuclease V) alpha subunit